MKKLVSCLLTVTMLATLCVMPAVAEESAIRESASGFYYIEANGDQVKLSAASQDTFIQADGLYFKDLNGNGTLDTYEDWRLGVDERAASLASLMTLKEKAGILGFGGIAGNNGVVVSNLTGDVEGSTGDTASIINLEHPSLTASADVATVTVGETTYPSMRYQAQVMGISTYIAAMTGTPKDQLDLLNGLQAIAEESRLGIPAVFSGDRSYNTWGGMVDMAHYALGVAHDEELLYNLVSEYAKESVALGYHQVFHGYGNEIGSWYGDEVNYIARMSAVETRAYDDNGFNSHSKHFIARGGRNAYVAAKSPADLIDSWMVGWKAVVDAGTQWIMTNNNVGITPGVQSYMDKNTYDLLRVDLGYDGIVCLDWPLSPTSLMSQTGVTADGVDISTLTLGERYVLILNAGVDMFSCGFESAGTDIGAYTGAFDMVYFPEVLVAEVEAGRYTEEAMDVHVLRILKNKFDLGIFEDPFSDWGEALELIGSDAYKAEQIVPMNNDDVNASRRSEITAMEEELMVKSTILLKNDGILPLAEGTKVYANSNNTSIKEGNAAALPAYATLVDSFEEADVVLAHVTSFDENYDYMVEDAQAAGKPMILILQATTTLEPNIEQMNNSAAVLMETYVNTPDHGSSVGSFYRYVTPSITADMLFGKKEPAGSTVFEIGLDSQARSLAWGELQMDIGVEQPVRLYMAMLAKRNPTILMPENLGDVICTTGYGMSYSKPAAIELSMLTVPETTEVQMQESAWGTREVVTVVNARQAAGVPFQICFVASNNGGDGHVTAQIMDGDSVIAEKFVALDEGQFRVITMDITLEAGEHTLSLGDMSTTIVVE